MRVISGLMPAAPPAPAPAPPPLSACVMVAPGRLFAFARVWERLAESFTECVFAFVCVFYLTCSLARSHAHARAHT